jgi:NAD(P)H dehydrogenase (quinone)
MAANMGGGATAYVTCDDVAATAAAALADDSINDEILDVTGPDAVSATDVAATLSDITGRTVRYEYLTDDEFVAALVSGGQPASMAHIFAAAYRSIREGWLSEVTGVVKRISGREPTSVAEFLAANRTALLSS